MTIRNRLTALESRRGHDEVLIAQPWGEFGPHTPEYPPTEAEIAEHHERLKAALANPKAVIIDRPGADDPWRVRPILDADRGPKVTIERSYGRP